MNLGLILNMLSRVVRTGIPYRIFTYLDSRRKEVFMESLRSYLKSFIEMRVEKAGIRAGQNKRARNSRLRIEEIQRMIVSKMSFEDEELLLQYEEAISAKDVIIYERIYWQGLKDGIRIANKSKDITRM
jgi:hypothetical protein